MAFKVPSTDQLGGGMTLSQNREGTPQSTVCNNSYQSYGGTWTWTAAGQWGPQPPVAGDLHHCQLRMKERLVFFYTFFGTRLNLNQGLQRVQVIRYHRQALHLIMATLRNRKVPNELQLCTAPGICHTNCLWSHVAITDLPRLKGSLPTGWLHPMLEGDPVYF